MVVPSAHEQRLKAVGEGSASSVAPKTTPVDARATAPGATAAPGAAAALSAVLTAATIARGSMLSVPPVRGAASGEARAWAPEGRV